MNYNIVAYFLYFAITFLIIVKVGRICYQNGNVFVSQLIPNHEDLCKKINHLLLIGYYLLNIGYCTMTIISWKKIGGFTQLIEIISLKTSLIILIIALMHYLNILLLTNYIKKLI